MAWHEPPSSLVQESLRFDSISCSERLAPQQEVQEKLVLGLVGSSFQAVER